MYTSINMNTCTQKQTQTDKYVHVYKHTQTHIKQPKQQTLSGQTFTEIRTMSKYQRYQLTG